MLTCSGLALVPKKEGKKYEVEKGDGKEMNGKMGNERVEK
jgi:hypothetical protein